VPELLCPSSLLGGYTLEVLGPATVAGRDAIAVAATPRRDVLGSGSAERSYDRIEVAVDAELGILLRRIETSGGELVTLTELTDVAMNPPEAADPRPVRAATGQPPRRNPGGEPEGKAQRSWLGRRGPGGGQPRRADQAWAVPARSRRGRRAAGGDAVARPGPSRAGRRLTAPRRGT
jgi:hypothetical protein